ncbi:MAG: hypothetical protein AAGA80_24850, partial [Cyanobacteria bacterium P01_F01_bin.143]
MPSVYYSLNARITENFRKVEIKPISDSFKTEIKKKLNELSIVIANKYTDDTIGSYFVPIEEMRSRYDAIITGFKNNDDNLLQYEILRSYKCVEFWRRKNRGKTEEISKYVKKRLDSHYGNKINLTDSKFEELVIELCRKGLVKWESLEDKKISIEAPYLNFINLIPITTLDSYEKEIKAEEKEIAEEIIDYYPDTINASKVIHRVSTKELALQVYERMDTLGIEPDHYTFNSLMIKMEDKTEISNLVDEMKATGLEPDEFTYTIWICKQDNYDDAFQLYQQMLDSNKDSSFTVFSA